MICYHGHQIYRTGFERTDNQGCREAALNFWMYSLLSVYRVTILVKQNNKLNLTDINIICEEIMGSILNYIFDLNLVATSVEVSGNFVAVDLVDFNKKVAYQVTTDISRDKMNNTVKKFNKSKLSDQIEMLNVLILGQLNGHKYDEPHELALDNGNKFSFINNIYDFDKLIEIIKAKSVDNAEIVSKLYDDFYMIFDTGRLKYNSIVTTTSSLQKNDSFRFFEMYSWRKGFGDVQLSAFLPVNYEDRLGACLKFRKHDLAGIDMTFGPDVLLRDYFVEEDEFLKKHSDGMRDDKEIMYMHFNNIYFEVNAHTAYHVYQLFSDLHRDYCVAMDNINAILGTKNMVKENDAYCIGTMNEEQWDKIVFFARQHSVSNSIGNLKWNIFQMGYSSSGFLLQPNDYMEPQGNIFAKIFVERTEYSNTLKLYWKPGYKNGLTKMDGFDNKIKWKADFTADWIYNKLLPRAEKFYKKSRGFRY